MKRILIGLLALAILATFAACYRAVKDWHESECWAWYDAGYDDCLERHGFLYINGHREPTESEWNMFDEGYKFALWNIDVPQPDGEIPHQWYLDNRDTMGKEE